MKAVIQRVSRASVTVDGAVIGEISAGLLVLVAVHRQDSKERVQKMAARIAGLRVFNDSEGKMNLSIRDVASKAEPGILVISNFTVYGETAKNRRPSFVESAPFEQGNKLYQQLIEELVRLDMKVETGSFGADMQVELVNDGPVTVILET